MTWLLCCFVLAILYHHLLFHYIVSIEGITIKAFKDFVELLFNVVLFSLFFGGGLLTVKFLFYSLAQRIDMKSQYL